MSPTAADCCRLLPSKENSGCPEQAGSKACVRSAHQDPGGRRGWTGLGRQHCLQGARRSQWQDISNVTVKCVLQVEAPSSNFMKGREGGLLWVASGFQVHLARPNCSCGCLGGHSTEVRSLPHWLAVCDMAATAGSSLPSEACLAPSYPVTLQRGAWLGAGLTCLQEHGLVGATLPAVPVCGPGLGRLPAAQGGIPLEDLWVAAMLPCLLPLLKWIIGRQGGTSKGVARVRSGQ